MSSKADVKILGGSRGGGKTLDQARAREIARSEVAIAVRKIGERCPHDYFNWLVCPICNPKQLSAGGKRIAKKPIPNWRKKA